MNTTRILYQHVEHRLNPASRNPNATSRTFFDTSFPWQLGIPKKWCRRIVRPDDSVEERSCCSILAFRLVSKLVQLLSLTVNRSKSCYSPVDERAIDKIPSFLELHHTKAGRRNNVNK